MISGPIVAQKELWGVNSGDQYVVPSSYFGNITKYNILGEQPVMMHQFDSIQGYAPVGKLFQASNGKLYGTTTKGGGSGREDSLPNAGVLYEYDLIFDQYKVLYNFDSPNPIAVAPEISIIEPSPGQLYGAALNRIFKHDITTENMFFSNPLGFGNVIHGGIIKASNGNLYGTSYAGNCTGQLPLQPVIGNIFKYTIATNNLSFVYSNYCEYINGSAPNTTLIEISSGKLIGTTRNGGIHSFTDPSLRGGTIFEFDTNTNSFLKKIDFGYATTGVHPFNLVNSGDGTFYGVCEEGGIPQECDPTHNFGTLYQYTPTTNLIEVKHFFNFCDDLSVRFPSFLMKTSVGHFVGTTTNGGMFRWDVDSNTITMPDYTGVTDPNLNNAANLIEICRKPSYQFFDVNTFDGCMGGTFSYNIQNTNATTYQWLKDGNNVSNQTTGILNLTNLAASDAGNYTCLMTNECGMTTTMVLHLTVTCLGTDTFADLEKSIKLYPNPTKDILNIKLPENITITISNIKIANSLGQIVREQKMQNSPTIDVGELQNGIYFISLTTNYGVWNGKFVKE